MITWVERSTIEISVDNIDQRQSQNDDKKAKRTRDTTDVIR